MIDRRGDRGNGRWTFGQRSPYHLATLEGHTQFVRELAMSPDGTTLASGSGDSTIKLWDTKTYEEMATLRGSDSEIWSVAFSPDGSMLAAGTFRRLDHAVGRGVAETDGHAGGAHVVDACVGVLSRRRDADICYTTITRREYTTTTRRELDEGMGRGHRRIGRPS